MECFSITESAGETGLAINVAPNCTPGIVFQHVNGRSAIEKITTLSKTNASVPTSFLYGPGIERSVMHYGAGSYMTVHVILKPHALNTLFGMNACTLTNGFLALDEISNRHLDDRLLETIDAQEQVALLIDFLIRQLEQITRRDELVEEGLQLIHRHVASTTVRSVVEHLTISERQFERRFKQTVGVTPQSYIRVRRFHEAIRLIRSGQFKRLTDVAYALDFYDQSHLIRDIKAFSGLTPKEVAMTEDHFDHAEISDSSL